MRYEKETYGEYWSPFYDQFHPEPLPHCIEFLEQYSGPGPVLELGVGTGRLAVPLVEAGVELDAIEASPEMLEILRGKTDKISVVGDDFSNFQTARKYSMIFIAFNTLYALTTQELQLECLKCAAQALAPGGRFVLELFVPDMTRFDRGQRLSTVRIDEKECLLEACTHDPVHQLVQTQLIALGGTQARLLPIKLRYVWPTELDLMARLAGLQLVERFGGWDKIVFDHQSDSHISVYELS